MALDFRRAAQGEEQAVAALVNSAYRGDSSRRGWTTEADLLQGQRTDAGMVKADIEDWPRSSIELMRLDGKLLGCCCLQFDDAKKMCHLGMFTVDPALQGQGFGKQLLEHAESVARQRGCAQMQITVISVRAELLQFYQRRGFRKTGEEENFPYGDERFGLPQRPDLKFVEMIKPL